MREPLDAMIEALDLEVAASRTKGGGIQIGLGGGERVGQAENSWLYRFPVVEDLQLRDDTPVRVLAGQEDVPGILVSMREGVLVVALDKDVGEAIPAARLVANDTFLVERLKERLEKIRSGRTQFDRASADRAIGHLDSVSSDAEPHPDVLADGAVNVDQAAAVRRSLGSNVTFVWGPPGTGKTTALARIVEAHYRDGRSVLLVSNTNIAVDTALERVADRLKGEPEFHRGLVIRQGPVVKDELSRRFGSQVILEQIVSRLGRDLQRERASLAVEAESVRSEGLSLAELLKDHERMVSAESSLDALHRAHESLESRIRTREQEGEQQRTAASRLRAESERARAMGAIKRFFSRLNPARLDRAALAAEQAAVDARDAAAALATDLPNVEREITTLRDELEQLRTKMRPHPPKPEIDAHLSSLRERLRQILARKEALEQELSELQKQILARCRILAATAYRTYLSKEAGQQFDTVVIDEASMLIPPLVYFVAGLATRSVVVAGDFRQLPPIVSSTNPRAQEWLQRDVFEIAEIPQRLERREVTPNLVVLGTQYRMREPICDVVNTLFYPDHPLRSDPSVMRPARDFPLASAPLLYVDTAPFHPWTAMRVGSYSRYNVFHALLVRSIVLHLAETGYLPPAGEPNDAVGVVVPYAAQARLIQALLNDRLGERAAGIAATVHRFQGNEKSTILLDLTDSLGARLGRFLEATRLEEDGARLLNVAVSRARHHVVLIGNLEYLRAKAPPKGFVRRLVDQFTSHGERLELDALLPLVERDWIDGLSKILPPTFDFPDGAAGAFTEGTFYPAFQRDLARARESLVILSPFATGRGTSRWADPLRAAIARGVRVRVVMRPASTDEDPDGEDVAALIRGLRDLGVVVDLRARMHEKIAVVDSRVLWHGSLNILSHRDTHESMLRIESPATCQQLARFLTPPTGRREESPALDVKENPACPDCGGPTIWKEGRDGISFECEDPACGGERDSRGQQANRRSKGRTWDRGGRPSGARGAGNAPIAGQACPEPGCGGRMVERRGPYSRFLGCTNYPNCRHTEK